MNDRGKPGCSEHEKSSTVTTGIVITLMKSHLIRRYANGVSKDASKIQVAVVFATND
jgi:hypothetical protein